MLCRLLLLFGWLPAVCLTGSLFADDKEELQKAELKKLSGRWTTVREKQVDPDKVVRRRVELEFSDGHLVVYIYDEKDEQIHAGGLKVTAVEKNGGLGLTYRLILNKGEVFYDIVGKKLILVGRIGPRPWEGFPLSGEYQRAKNPK